MKLAEGAKRPILYSVLRLVWLAWWNVDPDYVFSLQVIPVNIFLVQDWVRIKTLSNALEGSRVL